MSGGQIECVRCTWEGDKEIEAWQEQADSNVSNVSNVSTRAAVTTSRHALLIAELTLIGTQGARSIEEDNIKLGSRQ